jgi:polysaccharide biosynthesis/export protein
MAALFLALILALGASDARAQTATVPPLPPPDVSHQPPAPAPPSTVAPAQSPPPPGQTELLTDYRVGPQDVLNITVFGEPQLSGRVRVDSDGTIPFQYLQRVKAEDLTVTQIAEALRTGLGDGYLRNPQVSVEVEQYHSQNVYVLGEVKSPGKYSLPGNSTLVDVLTQAGSTTQTAGHWVLVNHVKQGSTLIGPATIADNNTADLKINLSDIQSGKAQNIRISDGDTVYVPKADRIFVIGQVRAPGPFTYDENMSVFEAISLAGGATEKGSTTRISILRLIKGEMKEIDAKPTDKLKPGDQVKVKPRRL